MIPAAERVALAHSGSRELIVRALRETEIIRRYRRSGSLLSPAEIGRAFNALADAGQWNREHPDDAITADEAVWPKEM